MCEVPVAVVDISYLSRSRARLNRGGSLHPSPYSSLFELVPPYIPIQQYRRNRPSGGSGIPCYHVALDLTYAYKEQQRGELNVDYCTTYSQALVI